MLRLPFASFASRKEAGAARLVEDSTLLARYVDEQDQAAFELLVRRHGPLVLGLCQKLVRDAHRAEDAFQATFLTLALKANSVKKYGSVSSWLFKVAYRVSLRVRARSARFPVLFSKSAAEVTQHGCGNTGVTEQELAEVIALELAKLPEAFRSTFLMCHVHGLSHSEVAAQLGIAINTVASRVARVRSRLKRKLKERGWTVPAGGILAALLPTNANALTPALIGRINELSINHVTGSLVLKTLPQGILALLPTQGWMMSKFSLYLGALAIGTATVVGIPFVASSYAQSGSPGSATARSSGSTSVLFHSGDVTAQSGRAAQPQDQTLANLDGEWKLIAAETKTGTVGWPVGKCKISGDRIEFPESLKLPGDSLEWRTSQFRVKETGGLSTMVLLEFDPPISCIVELDGDQTLKICARQGIELPTAFSVRHATGGSQLLLFKRVQQKAPIRLQDASVGWRLGGETPEAVNPTQETTRRAHINWQREKAANIFSAVDHRVSPEQAIATYFGLPNSSTSSSLPEEAQRALTEYNVSKQKIQTEFESKLDEHRLLLKNKLMQQKDAAIKEGNLDAAIAIRNEIRTLDVQLLKARPNPGTLSQMRGEVGKSFNFWVTGETHGSIWGDGSYTDDSSLATVAVHAGLLKKGQSGIIKVTIESGKAKYGGAKKNGITSSNYDEFPGSYRVEVAQ